MQCSMCHWPYRAPGKPCSNCGYSGCFITAAACAGTGEPHDSGYLDDVRFFRDTYMQETKHRKALVDEYYEIAPAIVDAIDSRSDAAAEYSRIRRTYLDKAVAFIRESRCQAAEEIYVSMVSDLAALHHVSRRATT